MLLIRKIEMRLENPVFYSLILISDRVHECIPATTKTAFPLLFDLQEFIVDRSCTWLYMQALHSTSASSENVRSIPLIPNATEPLLHLLVRPRLPPFIHLLLEDLLHYPSHTLAHIARATDIHFSTRIE